jgi:hypothetical protein
LKKDYLETSTGDSLDLIPIGAEYGKGYYLIILGEEKVFMDLSYLHAIMMRVKHMRL